MVDDLTLLLLKKLDITVPMDGIPKLEEFGTNSIDAFRFYHQGVHFARKYDIKNADYLLKKAIEIDSTFALAYLELCRIY